VPGSGVVHSDDIAWEHSRFDWSDLLADGILAPVRLGRGVRFRPPRWAEHGRDGSALIWVQSDEREAARRGRARPAHADAIDGANMPADGSPPDDAAWMAEEIPFNTDQRTWERADLIVCGTPQIPYDPATEIVVAEPRWRE
jgi:hypothetical protein